MKSIFLEGSQLGAHEPYLSVQCVAVRMQCVVAYCSVLLCVAVCCSVLHCATSPICAGLSVLQCEHGVLQCKQSVLPCVAVCCSVLRDFCVEG